MNYRRILKALVLGLSIMTAQVVSAESAETKPSVTVYPVIAAPDDFPDDFSKRVGMVLATMLENGGLEQLEMAETKICPCKKRFDKGGFVVVCQGGCAKCDQDRLRGLRSVYWFTEDRRQADSLHCG